LALSRASSTARRRNSRGYGAGIGPPLGARRPHTLRVRRTGGSSNNKLGVLKRTAYGFVNASKFAARALLLTRSLAT
jgi:hypothetical protein